MWYFTIISKKLHWRFVIKSVIKSSTPQNFIIFASKFILDTIKSKLNLIKAVLAEQEKTSKWLAGQVGKSASTVSKWCNNVVQPDLNILDKIAKLLDVDLKDLLNSTEK